ncbi:hypothetical protein V6N13_008985 [Hibiscus sabdariffa]
MVHVQGKCSDERVNTVTNDVSVTNDSVKGKSVIVGSSNRFAVLVDMDPTQISSTSHVAGEASVETSGAGNDVLGQVAERVARQPREAAKAMARIVQDLKAQKQNKGGARKQNKGGKKGGGVASEGGRMALAFSPMKFLFWNTRGFNDPKKHACVLSRIQVYAHNGGEAKRSLWNSLNVLRASFGDSPSIVVGDFNVILGDRENFDCFRCFLPYSRYVGF